MRARLRYISGALCIFPSLHRQAISHTTRPEFRSLTPSSQDSPHEASMSDLTHYNHDDPGDATSVAQSVDKDPRHLTAPLKEDAHVTEKTQESSHLFEQNTSLQNELKETRVQLLLSKQKQAVMEDALSEMRAELPPTRRLLEQLLQFLRAKEIRVPGKLKAEYTALWHGDPLDIKPAFKPISIARSEHGLVHADAQKVGHTQQANLAEEKCTMADESPAILLRTSDGENIVLKNEALTSSDNASHHDPNAGAAATSSTHSATSQPAITAKKKPAARKRGGQDGIGDFVKRIKAEQDLATKKSPARSTMSEADPEREADHVREDVIKQEIE